MILYRGTRQQPAACLHTCHYFNQFCYITIPNEWKFKKYFFSLKCKTELFAPFCIGPIYLFRDFEKINSFSRFCQHDDDNLFGTTNSSKIFQQLCLNLVFVGFQVGRVGLVQTNNKGFGRSCTRGRAVVSEFSDPRFKIK